MIRQQKSLISQFKKLTLNQQVQIMAAVNYVMSLFYGNINIVDLQELKLYIL